MNGGAVTLRLRYVAGVSPAKWLRVWSERRPDLPLEAVRVEQHAQLDELRAGDADVAFVRLPVDQDGLHAIELWDELGVAVLPKDHPFAEAESLTLGELADEPLAPVQPDSGMTVELVAAGTGYALLPQGVARLHSRRDVVAVPVADAEPTRIALVWRVERDDDDIQEFVGIVRGRRAASSRGAASDEPTLSPAKAAKLAAAERRAAERSAAGRSGTAKSGQRAPRSGQGAKQRHRRRGR